jgi:hypothetical protein
VTAPREPLPPWLEEFEDDFCASFDTAEKRASVMFGLFANGLPIGGIDRERPRVQELLRLYAEEHQS